MLRQIGRLDGLVPYLVADNWATFFITIVSTLLTLVGIGDEFAIIALGILVIIVEVNIARLIVTLPATADRDVPHRAARRGDHRALL